MDHDTEPAGDGSCPLCGTKPGPSGASLVIGQIIAGTITLTLAGLVLYWPVRWVGYLYVDLFTTGWPT